MSALVRTSSGDFSLDDAIKLSDLQALADENRVHEVLIAPELLIERYKIKGFR
jgi:tRNA U55 pseudouridine synthase TruB